jgi:hypothetical protein
MDVRLANSLWEAGTAEATGLAGSGKDVIDLFVGFGFGVVKV